MADNLQSIRRTDTVTLNRDEIEIIEEAVFAIAGCTYELRGDDESEARTSSPRTRSLCAAIGFATAHLESLINDWKCEIERKERQGQEVSTG